SSVSTISTWRFKGHALSSVGSKRSHTSIRTLKRRSSRSEIRMDITLRSVRSLGAKKRPQPAEAGGSSREIAPTRHSEPGQNPAKLRRNAQVAKWLEAV